MESESDPQVSLSLLALNLPGEEAEQAGKRGRIEGEESN